MNLPIAERRVLVLGGSGYVGREVVRAATRAGASAAFTYFRNEPVAASLSAETGALSFPVDLRDPASIRALFDKLDAKAFVADALVHAAVSAGNAVLAEVTDGSFDEMYAVNVRSAFVAAQCFASRLGDRQGDIAFTAALDGITKIPASVHFAACQSARHGMVHALARELGPRNVRVNLVLLGALSGGISSDIDPARLADFKRYSALQRTGTTAEAARAICRLLLDNRWMTGSVLPLTGGL